MLFNFDRLGDDFDLLNDARCALGVFKFRAARRAMGKGMFNDLVDLLLGKLRTKMTFVTILAAALFLIRCVAILVFGVVIGTGFFPTVQELV